MPNVRQRDRLGLALGLVVDDPHSYLVDVASILLVLGVDDWVAVDLR